VCNDFTLSHYIDTVNLYRDVGYKIIQIKDLGTLNNDDKYLLIRHDVDLSIKAAVELAAYEHVHNIITSYYILLYSPIYNTLSPTNIDGIRQIVKYGHQIGLHVDSRFETNFTSVSNSMLVLGDICGTHIETFAQHFRSATPKILFPSYIDGYWDIVNARFKYLSDSSMNWREDCFCQHLDKYKRLMVLIHPEWHVFEGKRGNIIDRARDIEMSRIDRDVTAWKDLQVKYLEQFGKIGINA